MQVQTIQGYFDKGIFYQQGQRKELPERQLVIINVLDIPVSESEIQNMDIEFWENFDSLAEDSTDEELLIADFPPLNFGHELVQFEEGEQLL